MEIEQNVWGFTPEGEAILVYTLTNSGGASVRLTNIGAGVLSICVPDLAGEMADVCLGYKAPMSYFGDGPYMGKIVGRYGNRIARGVFSLDDQTYRLACNNGANHLHGGLKGFDSRLWESRVEGEMVVFSLVSPAGDQGYPGELGVEVGYTWSEGCELEIVLMGKSDAPTIINLTNHAYFNLAGEDSGSIEGHLLQLNSNVFLDTDSGSIPTQPTDVAGTPMDFRVAKPVGQDINTDYQPLKFGAGYDHCFVVDGWQSDKMCYVGTLTDSASGRQMKIESTQPGVQIYSGNWLAGSPESKSGRSYDNRDGIAIECQGFPDAPNRPDFPSQRIDAGEMYSQKIRYTFSVG